MHYGSPRDQAVKSLSLGGDLSGGVQQVGYVGLLTLKFDTATWPFPKIDMRHGVSRQAEKINNISWVGF